MLSWATYISKSFQYGRRKAKLGPRWSIASHVLLSHHDSVLKHHGSPPTANIVMPAGVAVFSLSLSFWLSWLRRFIYIIKKSKVGGVAYVGISQTARESIPFSTSARPGRLFCIWGGALHLPSAPHFTAQIQAVLLIRWVGEGRHRTLWFLGECSTEWAKPAPYEGLLKSS